MDTIKAMRAFVAVVDTGGFTRASELLGTPKATLSASVAELEAHLKVRLLHRTTRRVSVTADGAAYYERCVRILEDLRDAEESFSSRQANPRGRLRVDVATAVASRLLIPQLHTFFERYTHYVSSDSAALKRFAIQQGESVHDAIERLLRQVSDDFQRQSGWR